MQLKEPEAAASALIVSEVRFLRECLADILHRAPGWVVLGQCATLAHASVSARELRPEIMLLDSAFPSGKEAAFHLSTVNPDGSVVALAVVETEASIIGWAEAGVKGYVPNTASVDDLVALIAQIVRGEQTCSTHVAGGLLRRVASANRTSAPAPATPSALTGRELEILRLVGSGLSNKDIARRLGVSLGTTKTHVHNLLGKLRLRRRSEVMLSMHAPLMPGIDIRPLPASTSPLNR